MWGGASSIIQDSSLKLWLDASNPLSYPGTGTLWSDLSGNGNNGTMVNGVTYSTANGGVMSFDGVNDFVNVGSINAATNELTISCWFKSPVVNQNRAIIAKWKTSTETDNSYCLLNETPTQNKFSFMVYQANNAVAIIIAQDFTILPNTWYHITATAANGVLSIYVNGVKSANTATYNGTIKQTTRPTMIGKLRIEDALYISNAQINEPLIYTRALTTEEVNQNFQATRNKYGI